VQKGPPYLFLCAILIWASAQAQVRINELMASNTRAYPDIVDFEDYPDWLELYNSGGTEQSLAGYYLSDDPENPYKWQFAGNATIPAEGYLIVVADGNDAQIGDVRPRGYWPWRSFTVEKFHSNFSLSSGGESVILTYAPDDTLIPLGATWRYVDDGSDLGVAWHGVGFDDSEWADGPATLGYGDDPVTTLSFGDDQDRNITTYFRHSFTVDDAAAFFSLQMRFQVDDSAVVYLNGKEVVRNNLPDGAIDYLTRASEAIVPAVEEVFHVYHLDPADLVSGANVLAVEVHQIRNTSTDLRLDLEMTGGRLDGISQIDEVSYSQQVTDVSYGRSAGNPTQWVQFAQSSPGQVNGGPLVTDLRMTSGEATFSPEAGLHSLPLSVTLSAATGEIRYTLDGSDPDPDSALYAAPIDLMETTVVRARLFEAGKVPGPVVTRTYFVGEVFDGLPLLSISADPKTLFDDEIGIYQNTHEPNQGVGPAVYKGKDAPGHMEFFPDDGSEGFAVNGGLRMGGENNWASHFQRAFNFSLRGKYGDDELKYELFPGTNIPVFTSLTIREGGDDYAKARLTDPLFDTITRGRMEVDTNKSRPAVTFVNGVYWGLYNVRDRWDDNWMYQHYGTDDGAYDRVSFQNTSRSTPPLVENGSNEAWLELFNLARYSDVTDPEVWQTIEDLVDLDSFIDFVVCESWPNNTSWSGNREAWRPHVYGGKWRWFLPDMDRTFGSTSYGALGRMLASEQLLRYLKDNAGFRARLAQRYAAHMGSTLAPGRINDMITSLGGVAAAGIPRQYLRWGEPALATYQASLTSMQDFVVTRSLEAIPEVGSALRLGRPVALALGSVGLGAFRVAGVEMESGTHQFFPSLETTIEAVPAPGYVFDSWQTLGSNAATTFNLSGSTTFIANFIPAPTPVLGGTLAVDTTLSETSAPYAVGDDLVVPAGVTLTLGPGVMLEFAEGRNLRVFGTLLVQGESDQEVVFRGRDGARWGGVSFEEPVTHSSLMHLVVRDATRGEDPTLYPSAISGLNADLEIAFLDIDECFGPLFFRGGNLILRDSFVHIPITGDGLNVKQGQAQTLRCTFLGNRSPDTDAIDYDGVVNGVIRDCRIYRFLGFNSDGIDAGEQCVNLLIEGNRIFFNADKGISVGQGSGVVLKNNLIVGCAQGVGIKDTGSTVEVDQNTFVNCGEGVAVFKKNFGSGGGDAVVTNSLFSGTDVPVSVDALSTLSVNYSLSDTTALTGTANIQGDPLFTDPDQLDYSLSLASLALDSGDPGHAVDPDGSRADRAALYVYDPDDYPFLNSNAVVVNEVLANSGLGADWVELHNRSADTVDIGGWFLSDDGSDLGKYRIADGTLIGPGQFLIFYEDENFGEASSDPGKIVSFGLSDSGETVHLSSAEEAVITDYRFSEKFGASLEGVTLGFYYKPSSDSYNFIPLKVATPAAPNSAPQCGPVVISEIMYLPASGSNAEYLELLNISSQSIDIGGWRIDDGFDFEFPGGSTIAPGERIILADLASLSNYVIPAGTQIFRWSQGKLSNGGETVQLSRPGPLDGGEVSYARVDRVKYSSTGPWPVVNAGEVLLKIAEMQYGNDFSNWQAGAGNPGELSPGIRFDTWAGGFGLNDPNGDPDRDFISTLVEYALGTDPTVANESPPVVINHGGTSAGIDYTLDVSKTDIDVVLLGSSDLETWYILPTTPAPLDGVMQTWRVDEDRRIFPRRFYMLQVTQKP
jgi:hypothetical protein